MIERTAISTCVKRCLLRIYMPALDRSLSDYTYMPELDRPLCDCRYTLILAESIEPKMPAANYLDKEDFENGAI